LETRRRRLRELVGRDRATLKLSPSFAVEPAVFFQTVVQQGLEGMILKRHGSAYEPGQRSGAWLKVKHLNEQEFVIGGFTPPKRSRTHFGSILIGYYQGKDLIYAGKVGTGFDGRLLQSLHEKFQRLRTPRCPFANLPLQRKARFGQGMTASVMRTVTWLRPQLVAQVKFAEWTLEGLLRQPVFLGLRKDKSPQAVRREAKALPSTPPRRK
jgi:bifunctional non-homologous end joining protein LigD